MRAATTFNQPHRPAEALSAGESTDIADRASEMGLRLVNDAPAGLRQTGSNAQPRRILLIASAGGHWLELCRLAEAFRDFDCQFVCTTAGLVAPVGDRPVAVLSDGSRKRITRLFGTAAAAARLIRAFRPDIVLTTGSAPGSVALVVARAHGLHTVWIESISSRDELSLSGRVARRTADLFLTQWPTLSARHRSARYFGRVL